MLSSESSVLMVTVTHHKLTEQNPEIDRKLLRAYGSGAVQLYPEVWCGTFILRLVNVSFAVPLKFAAKVNVRSLLLPVYAIPS
jgi:hypothetical protein